MEHRPIAANSILCFSLWVAGDGLAQSSEHMLRRHHLRLEASAAVDDDKDLQASSSATSWSLDQLDLVRMRNCAAYGAFVTGPLVAIWYPLLDKYTQKSVHPLAKWPVWGGPIFKVLLDEFVMDPPTIVMFFGYMNICEGGNMQSFQQKLKNEFMTTWLTSLAVWPPILLGTFRFLPIYAQAPVINACAIVWDGFLSHRNAASRIEEEAKQMQHAAVVRDQQDNNSTLNHNLSTKI